MPSYREALEIILGSISVMDIEEKPVVDAVGQVLAEDIFSDYNLPQTDTSGPDGYAVRSADVKEASEDSPVTLRIIDTIRAGHLPEKAITAGTTMRIMTGAVLPEGADSVIRFEDTDEPGDKNGPNRNNPTSVKIFATALPGTNVNKAGHSIAKGALALPKGKAVGAAQVSILISIGKSRVKVFRRPVVAVLSNGDELIGPGETLVPGKSYNCNAPAIAVLVAHYGGVARILDTASDTEESIVSRMRQGAEADVIITSGGVSRGDFDLVRLSIARLGEMKFVRVKTVPGASFSFGVVNRASSKGQSIAVPVFALAGPPTGCLINFEMLARPALLKMLGYTKLEHPFVEVAAPEAIPEKKMMFVRWSNVDKAGGEYHVKLKDVRMGEANSLTPIPEGKAVDAGGKIKVWPLDWAMDYQV